MLGIHQNIKRIAFPRECSEIRVPIYCETRSRAPDRAL